MTKHFFSREVTVTVVAGDAVASNTTVACVPKRVVAGARVTCRLHAFDAFGNLVKSLPAAFADSISVSMSAAGSRPPQAVQRSEDNMTISFATTLAGNSRFSVQLANGEGVGDGFKVLSGGAHFSTTKVSRCSCSCS